MSASDRRHHRRRPAERHGLRFARIRPGHDVSILDVSATGMLVESTHRLLPGARVSVRVWGERSDADVVQGRIVRCAVSWLKADQIAYRGAITFDRECVWLGDRESYGYAVPAPESPPNHKSRVPTTREVR